MTALNPFIWDREIEDGIGRDEFAADAALKLKAGQHIALFGPRGTGKSTFTLELMRELAKEHGDDAVPWESIRVDLRPVVSLEGFVAAISQAVERHPSKALRRRVEAEFQKLDKEFGINLGIVRFAVGSSPGIETLSAILGRQLQALRTLDSKLVVIFDEFQRLASCPGDPLSLIRSHLMSGGQGQETSLLLTGSLRQKLDLMLQNSTEPIWDQTYDMDLPPISIEEFSGFVEYRFESSGRPIDDRATDHLFTLTEGHPKRTQQLAWMAWELSSDGAIITSELVSDAFDYLVENKSAPGRDFAVTFDNWLNGDEAEFNNARVLLLLASGMSPGSQKAAARFGIGSNRTTDRALHRLAERGYVDRPTARSWRIIDPLFREYLSRQPEAR